MGEWRVLLWVVVRVVVVGGGWCLRPPNSLSQPSRVGVVGSLDLEAWNSSLKRDHATVFDQCLMLMCIVISPESDSISL
jgi:hypothetical protein